MVVGFVLRMMDPFHPQRASSEVKHVDVDERASEYFSCNFVLCGPAAHAHTNHHGSEYNDTSREDAPVCSRGIVDASNKTRAQNTTPKGRRLFTPLLVFSEKVGVRFLYLFLCPHRVNQLEHARL